MFHALFPGNGRFYLFKFLFLNMLGDTMISLEYTLKHVLLEFLNAEKFNTGVNGNKSNLTGY